jgi:RNase H
LSTGQKSHALPAVEIYTDGGCEPNPGPGGYGAVLIHPKKRKVVSGGFRMTTNNRMEIFAAIAGLELLKQPCKVTIYSDSSGGGRVRDAHEPRGRGEIILRVFIREIFWNEHERAIFAD